MSEEKKPCPSSIADLQGQFDDLIKFIEYEEAMTIDPRSQQKMSAKLIELGLWPSR